MTDNEPRPVHSFLAHEDGTTSASFSPDGQTLATGGYDCAVRLWEVTTWNQRLVLPGHRRGHVAFSPNGSILVSGGLHKNAVVYDTADWEPVRTLYSTGGIWDLAFTPCGSRLAIFQPNSERDDLDTPIEIRDTRTWRIVRKVGVGAVYVNALAYSLDGRWAAVAPANGPVGVWDAAFTKKITEFVAHEPATWGMAFSPDGGILATGGADNVARLWDTTFWTMQHELPHKELDGMGYGNGVLCAAFSRDGKTLVTGGLDGAITVWSLH